MQHTQVRPGQELGSEFGGRVPGFWGVFDGISGSWMREGGATNASSLPVVFCLGLLFLRASGLDVDSGDCVLFGGDVVVVYCT